MGGENLNVSTESCRDPRINTAATKTDLQEIPLNFARADGTRRLSHKDKRIICNIYTGVTFKKYPRKYQLPFIDYGLYYTNRFSISLSRFCLDLLSSDKYVLSRKDSTHASQVKVYRLEKHAACEFATVSNRRRPLLQCSSRPLIPLLSNLK